MKAFDDVSSNAKDWERGRYHMISPNQQSTNKSGVIQNTEDIDLDDVT